MSNIIETDPQPDKKPFIGTTNAAGLLIKTHDKERMFLSDTGHIHIGSVGNRPKALVNVEKATATAQSLLCVPGLPQLEEKKSVGSDFSMIRINQAGVVSQEMAHTQTTHVIHKRSTSQYKDWTMKDFIGTKIDAPLIFKTGDTTTDHHAERMRLSSEGVDIGTGTGGMMDPDVDFRVRGNVQIENLTAGDGQPLVLDSFNRLCKDMNKFTYQKQVTFGKSKTPYADGSYYPEYHVLVKGKDEGMSADLFGSIRISFSMYQTTEYWNIRCRKTNNKWIAYSAEVNGVEAQSLPVQNYGAIYPVAYWAEIFSPKAGSTYGVSVKFQVDTINSLQAYADIMLITQIHGNGGVLIDPALTMPTLTLTIQYDLWPINHAYKGISG